MMACLICGGNCTTVCTGAKHLPVPGAFEPYTAEWTTHHVGFPPDWTLEKANAEIIRLRAALSVAEGKGREEVVAALQELLLEAPLDISAIHHPTNHDWQQGYAAGLRGGLMKALAQAARYPKSSASEKQEKE